MSAACNLRALYSLTLRSLVERTSSERGAVMAEYGLIIAVLFLSVVSAVGLFHDELIAFFTRAATTVNQGE